MNYKVRIPSSIRRRIVAWGLPDTVFVEIFLRLDRELAHSPTRYLVRTTQPFEGMTYGFSLVDPTNRLREYLFTFHVVYEVDEETLRVVNCGYYASSL